MWSHMSAIGDELVVLEWRPNWINERKRGNWNNRFELFDNEGTD
jgi:hypothetical protein